MDAYHKYRGVNGCNNGPDVFSGFHFCMEKGLQIFEGKKSKHIIHESIDTETHACGVCWEEWRQVKDVMNFKDEFMNVNTIIVDEFQTLEKRSSDTCRNRTYIFSVRMSLTEHTYKGTHMFIFLEVFNNCMNLGEFFRLDISKDFVQFWVMG